MTHLYYLAAAYGEGNYNACVYNATAAQTAECNGTNSGGSILANTGIGIAIAVTLAAALIFTAMLIRSIRKSKKDKKSEN